MHHTKLGRTGLRVSKLCLGTMTFGLQCDVTQSNAIMDAAAAGGIDFLDAADVYPLGGGHNTAGRTEQIVGDWLKGKRHQFIVATKCVGQMGPKPWDLGMSRKHILDAIDASLRRLGTDYVDLYQLHGYDQHTPIDEALEALDTVVRSGKARYAGVSNWPAYKVARALGRSEVKNIGRIEFRPAALQSPVPQLRTGPAAALRGGSDRGDPLQSTGRRPAHRQARPQGAAAGRFALPARHRRRPLSGTLLARPGIRNHRRPAPGGQGSGH